MEEIIKQYAPVIIVGLVVASLVAIVVFLMKNDSTGVVQSNFSGLIGNFFNKANNAIGTMNTINTTR